MAQQYMTADQRFAARRPDVLVFTTDVLEEDFTIAGRLRRISSCPRQAPIGLDLKVIDVYQATTRSKSQSYRRQDGGYQQLVRGDVMRASFAIASKAGGLHARQTNFG